MTLDATLERVSAIRHALADPAALIATGGTPAPGATAGASEAAAAGAAGASSFAAALQQASTGYEGADSASAPGQQPPYSAQQPPYSYGAGAPAAQGLAAASLTASGPSATGAGAGYPVPSLDGVAGPASLSPLEAAGEGSPGARIVAVAESQLGQSEQPPGSNESPAIATYRTATAGAEPGAPWCAYFASWVARQAGEPIGAGGQGAGAVSEIWSWAQSAGRAIANGPGVLPKPGDLIVFGGEHVGIVRGVLPDGQVETIEGNYENKVAANVRSPTEATGYVEMS